MENISLEQFYSKRVKIKLVNGDEYVGVVIGYWTAEENIDEENGNEESIGVAETRYSHDAVEVYRSEIQMIEAVS